MAPLAVFFGYMRPPSSRLLSLVALVAGFALALPPIAASAPVPPGNSAATQYTEAFPTSGGQQNAENGKGRKHRDPEEALGKTNAQRLDSQGAAGEAVAAFAAETGPGGVGAKGGGGGDADGAGKSPSGDGGSGSSAGGGHDDESSALGEVASQATGASSEGVDLLLPLAILGGAIWLLVYLLRRRRQAA